MKHYNSPRWALALLAFGTYCATAAAATISIQFDAAYNTPVRVDRTVDGGANWYMQDPGQIHFFKQAGGPSDVSSDFYTFCIEPREFLTPGTFYTYNDVPIEQVRDHYRWHGRYEGKFHP